MSATLGDLAPVSRKQSLSVLVQDQLRSAIMAGKFVPGERLTIRAVAAALDVSLTPAREALYNLAADGALETAANGSVQVPLLDERRIVEITKIRLSLEGLAAFEAAPNLNKKLVARIVAVNEDLIKADAAKDYKSLSLINWRFHFAIYEAAGMPQLVKMIENCWLTIGSYLNVIYPKYGEADVGIENHREIIRAVIAKDAAWLQSTVRRDIEQASQCLIDMIRHQSSS